MMVYIMQKFDTNGKFESFPCGQLYFADALLSYKCSILKLLFDLILEQFFDLILK